MWWGNAGAETCLLSFKVNQVGLGTLPVLGEQDNKADS